jgi:hypothetical protein
MKNAKEQVKQFCKSPEPKIFSELWTLNQDMAMKCLFYILHERKLETEFLNIFCGIVYKQQREIFDKNLSLIVGIPNDTLLTAKEIRNLAKDDWENNENNLTEFISPDYQESFRQEFYSRVRKTYFDKVYQLPIYGTVETLNKLKNNLTKDKIVQLTVDKLIREFPKESRQNYKTFEEQFKFVRGGG